MKPYNENIASHIKSYLAQAKERVWVNVPWFTHKELFQTLCNKAKKGIEVELILQEDEINAQTAVNHNELLQCGGKVYWYKHETALTGINHEKYCLIDDSYIIYGSFNWTYNADKNNLESILVGEKPVATELIHQFEKRFSQVRKRFLVDDPHPGNRLPLDINMFRKLEINLLQNECGWLEAYIHELETYYQDIRNYLNLRLGNLIIQKLTLEMLLEEKKAQKSKKKIYAENHRDIKKDYEDFKKVFDEFKGKDAEIERKAKSKKAESIKQLYRQLVKQVHPDKFMHDKSVMRKANALMSRINSAFENNDFDELSRIQDMIENGMFTDEDILNDSYNVPVPEKMLMFWRGRKRELQEKLNRLQNQEYYRIFSKQWSLDDYAEQLKIQFESDIRILDANLKNYES